MQPEAPFSEEQNPNQTQRAGTNHSSIVILKVIFFLLLVVDYFFSLGFCFVLFGCGELSLKEIFLEAS